MARVKSHRDTEAHPVWAKRHGGTESTGQPSRGAAETLRARDLDGAPPRRGVHGVPIRRSAETRGQRAVWAKRHGGTESTNALAIEPGRSRGVAPTGCHYAESPWGDVPQPRRALCPRGRACRPRCALRASVATRAGPAVPSVSPWPRVQASRCPPCLCGHACRPRGDLRASVATRAGLAVPPCLCGRACRPRGGLCASVAARAGPVVPSAPPWPRVSARQSPAAPSS